MFCLCLGATALLVVGCSKEGENTAQKGGKKKGGKKGGDLGPAPVVVATVQRKDIPIQVVAVGNVEPYSVISVKPQVGGQLTQIFIQEGDYVKKGGKLAEIDPRPLQAQVAQAEATLAKDNAQLQQVMANLARDNANEKYSQEQAKRYATLFDQGVVSKDDRERFASQADALSQLILADRATIESAKAQIQADQATLSNIRLQLSFTTIYAPIEGRTGNITVKAGNIVTPNQTELMTIAQVQPIYVTFGVPEARLGEIQRYQTGGRLAVDARSQDETDVNERGQLTFVDNNVDPTTGTIKLKSTFQNPGRKLWPGQFVSVNMRLTTQTNAIVVPTHALQTGQDGTYVYVVKDDRSVEMRPIAPGLRVQDDLVVDKGLAVGETVVTEGQLRLAPGSRVTFQGSGGEAVGAQGGSGADKGKGGGNGDAAAAPADGKGGERRGKKGGKKGDS
ncbi:MAG: efflux RND transporter periplasmic adaptor subunit [Bryobacteraceae bacterium]